MSANQWNQQARKVLKGAQQSNVFFNTQAFTEVKFPIKIPLEYANLVDVNNPNDPLLRQVIPQVSNDKSDYSLSPLRDEDNSPVDGLIHKYPNRVLLIASQVCAIHCQYCFRQNFDYTQHDALSNWPEIERYISERQEINEVILSGGDPLSLSDDKLEKLIKNIENFQYVRSLRIHSRSIVVMPSRMTTKLVEILAKTRLKVVLVTHINHANEISDEFSKNIANIVNATLLNQSVLLKGVNDDLNSLKALSLKLFDVGILPYYLHMLDKVEGAQNYFVSDDKAVQLHQQLQSQLSGYLVPKLVRDSGLSSKTWLL
ncbi:Lysine 2,3-aminomutase [Bathymodiolus heckerae thiotrophic gill symbiont]|uniref:KamA family radical SAM protein n=1 Tax=Bathymodiolus heckerae thiotrophic gill symbiont TaxID=1052212 RepID=UPI0010BAC9AF|nr:KamA family radical SAM protein [Bathymodiolus heckerae thiotrophic gill symbiont]CAC9543193.1 Lysine 2,3-aminomutase (EC 5.4.3.2) [uncultured Gammaproteobacteria bacterium]CAC9958927.1 Lysine 2,3-aminomutase (EC 5.4.3.2) [uncultured Gammaproteobacteria bacterium]SHN92432.1 Lysine 2,3-aminomutase [Bathymodiolus heckerae thiotrophic gill symbiont]